MTFVAIGALRAKNVNHWWLINFISWHYITPVIKRSLISAVILLLPLIQEGLLAVTSQSMCMKYWLNA